MTQTYALVTDKVALLCTFKKMEKATTTKTSIKRRQEMVENDLCAVI